MGIENVQVSRVKLFIRRKRRSSLLEDIDDQLNTALLLQCLKGQDGLYELHTHLLGMGNISFWIQDILIDRAKLPTQNDFINDDSFRCRLGPLVWNTKEKCFIDRTTTLKLFDELRSSYDSDPEKYNCDEPFKGMMSDEFHEQMKHHELNFQDKDKDKVKDNFSYDVVFSLENLAKGLGLEASEPRDRIQAAVEEKLGIHTRSDWVEHVFFKNWIIFNAREQKLQIVYGIQAEELRMLIGGDKPIDQIIQPAQRDARAHIINAFSMMNADGSEPCSVDFHSFRGAFTPEFYPRRYALKDSMYSQRLDILAYLLWHVLHRYDICLPPVTYCEFSVGCRDLSRPWVVDILSTFTDIENLRSTFKEFIDINFPWLKPRGFEKRIVYRFLAGFKRETPPVSNAYSDDKPTTLFFEVPHYAIHIMLKEFYQSDQEKPTIIFTEQVQRLLEMKKEAETIPYFFDLVVGLDLCGDELGHPYCPFIAFEFIKFVKEARGTNPKFVEEARGTNPNFGIRIHAGENVPFIRPELPGYRLFVAHMYILYRCIDFLNKKLKSHIRVGHGVAFDKLLSIKNHKYRKSSVLVAEMQRNAKSVFAEVPFEVNITSNFYLLGDAVRNVEKEKPLSYLYDIHVPVVLSTDNDGIWPIDKCTLGHQSHHSLAAEYCRAITTRFITEENQLEDIVRNPKRFCFDKNLNTKNSNQLNISKKENSTDSPYFPTDVIAHPDIIHMLVKLYQRAKKKTDFNFETYVYMCAPGTFSEVENSANNVKDYYEVTMRILMACFYLTRSSCYTKFENEYKEVFHDSPDFSQSNCEKIYYACANVHSQLMNDTPGEGASMQIMVGEHHYLFCSEIPDNRKGTPDFLLTTIENFIRKFTEPATIFSFLPNIDENNPKIKKYLENIGRIIGEKEIKIFIHTNTKKHIVFPTLKSGTILINPQPEKRTDANLEEIERILLYAVCPHGSVATSALHFIAKHIRKKDFSIEPQHVNLRSLIIPFLPLHFGYRKPNENESIKTKKSFLKEYGLTNTELAKSERMNIEKDPICKTLYDPKYNLLCTDVRFAKQIETSDLIEKINEDNTKFLEILKILHKSLKDFNMRPRSFVILENIKEYKDYKKDFENPDKIAIPIIQIKNKFLICSGINFFEKSYENPARLLWSLAVGWNPPLSDGNNPYEYPYSQWVKSIIEIGRKSLNKEFGLNTWENFVADVLCDADKRAWYMLTVDYWCDVIETAFGPEKSVDKFVKFLKAEKKHTRFKELLEDSNRHRIGNIWQTGTIEKRKAYSIQKRILDSLTVLTVSDSG
ncbi:unnamed protein product [Rotaria socialis]|uniref:Uncharacterized protein n=1 Tax=Rotaria socialis TaxID=392032 RepID=A0A821DNA5_9BILA|nr:unnamed protein product [Rotaria socialis]